MGEQFDPDTNPATGVFYNKLNISDRATLEQAEYELSAVRLRAMATNPVEGHFDLTHLQQIHKGIFEDVYDWAGKLRTVETSSRAPFAKPEYIETAAAEVFATLRTQHLFQDCTADTFVERAAWLYTELNAIHPFREGNGRANCQFLSQVASQAGYHIDWSKVNKNELDTAAAQAMSQSADLMVELLTQSVVQAARRVPAPPALIDRSSQQNNRGHSR